MSIISLVAAVRKILNRPCLRGFWAVVCPAGLRLPISKMNRCLGRRVRLNIHGFDSTHAQPQPRFWKPAQLQSALGVRTFEKTCRSLCLWAFSVGTFPHGSASSHPSLWKEGGLWKAARSRVCVWPKSDDLGCEYRLVLSRLGVCHPRVALLCHVSPLLRAVLLIWIWVQYFMLFLLTSIAFSLRFLFLLFTSCSEIPVCIPDLWKQLQFNHFPKLRGPRNALPSPSLCVFPQLVGWCLSSLWNSLHLKF